MQFISRTILATAVALTAFSAVAKPNEEAIRDQLGKIGLVPSSIEASPIKGLNEAVTERGIVYVSDDAQYFIAGHLYENGAIQPVNLTEKKMASLAKDKIAEMEQDMIVYPAKNEKYVVTVFTDTSCGYCRKLHSEIQGYNDQGITVRYLAFPRGGERSGNFEQMSAIWGAKDRVKAMNDAKNGSFDTSSIKPSSNLVLKQYNLGVEMGVSGTPAIVLEDGTMIPGYQPPEALRQILDSQSKS